MRPRSGLLALLILCASALAADPIAPGTWKGTYTGTTEAATGAIQLTLSKDGDRWAAESSFTVQGQDVKCKVNVVEVTGAKMRNVCTWEAQGYVLETTTTGELDGGKLTGAYRTVLKSEGTKIDEGTWTATAR
jgi:hypothetical protein